MFNSKKCYIIIGFFLWIDKTEKHVEDGTKIIGTKSIIIIVKIKQQKIIKIIKQDIYSMFTDVSNVTQCLSAHVVHVCSCGLVCVLFLATQR